MTGPAGPVGLTGAVGPAGPPGGAGANGTVAVYYDAVASATLTSSLNYATVATLPLPAGSYAISSKVNVYNAGSGELNARCELQSGSVSDESESNINAEYSAMFPDQIVVTLNAPSVASLSCVGAVTLDQIKITAIPVSGVAESATS